MSAEFFVQNYSTKKFAGNVCLNLCLSLGHVFSLCFSLSHGFNSSWLIMFFLFCIKLAELVELGEFN